MSSGKKVNPLTFKKGHLGGVGKVMCPKCHKYATKKNVNGQEVYKCVCGRCFNSKPIT